MAYVAVATERFFDCSPSRALFQFLFKVAKVVFCFALDGCHYRIGITSSRTMFTSS